MNLSSTYNSAEEATLAFLSMIELTAGNSRNDRRQIKKMLTLLTKSDEEENE